MVTMPIDSRPMDRSWYRSSAENGGGFMTSHHAGRHYLDPKNCVTATQGPASQSAPSLRSVKKKATREYGAGFGTLTATRPPPGPTKPDTRLNQAGSTGERPTRRGETWAASGRRRRRPAGGASDSFYSNSQKDSGGAGMISTGKRYGPRDWQSSSLTGREAAELSVHASRSKCDPTGTQSNVTQASPAPTKYDTSYGLTSQDTTHHGARFNAGVRFHQTGGCVPYSHSPGPIHLPLAKALLSHERSLPVSHNFASRGRFGDMYKAAGVDGPGPRYNLRDTATVNSGKDNAAAFSFGTVIHKEFDADEGEIPKNAKYAHVRSKNLDDIKDTWMARRGKEKDKMEYRVYVIGRLDRLVEELPRALDRADQARIFKEWELMDRMNEEAERIQKEITSYEADLDRMECEIEEGVLGSTGTDGTGGWSLDETHDQLAALAKSQAMTCSVWRKVKSTGHYQAPRPGGLKKKKKGKRK